MKFYRNYKSPNRRRLHFEMEAEFYVDRENQLVHILDANMPGTTTVTNSIGYFLPEIKKDIPIDNIDDYRFIAYCTDGVPFLYGNPGYLPVPPEFLYLPFLRKSREYVN